MTYWHTSNSSYGAYYKSHPKVPQNNHQSLINTPIHHSPQGLQNLGNTCYISAVLQVLFQILSPNSLNLTSTSQQRITYLFFQLRHSKDAHTYRRFKQALEDRVEIVRGWEQQDAHELMVHLIEQLRKENPLPLRSGKANLEYDQKRNSQKNWEMFTSQMLKLQNSKINSLFYGQILKSFTCPIKHNKHKFQRFMGISLPFPSGSNTANSYLLQGPIKLQDMIRNFIGHQTIKDLNCEQCNSKKIFIKESSFYSIPPFLVVHLSRFDKGWYSSHKNSLEVEFDLSLDLFQEMQSKKVVLRLLGVIHHVGTINRGHYFSQVRVGQDWFQMSDDRVSKTEMRVKGNVSGTAYILVYEKK